jgi:hypothetical protein
MWFKWSSTMPTKPELEACIAELESLITDLLADRDLQKERADEWQALAEDRQNTISDYRKSLQKELKETSKRHYIKRKGNKAKTEQMFEWYREYRNTGFDIVESRVNVANRAKLHRLTKTELTERQIKKRFDDQYGEDHDTKALAEY